MSNRLAKESSPYLLQHKDNPVDWYPWGAEAREAARRDDKPIFLSIGYSTCHWCHVMERESFEDEEVARLLNASFVSIKVDREERPDIDNIYMSVCQLAGGSCGWPLNVVMTPQGKPFFVGTYFPKTERGGRIGMIQLVPKLAEAWRTDRDRIQSSADNIVDALSNISKTSPGQIDPDWIRIAQSQLTRSHDRINGGFGSRPKFPSPHNLLFLMRGSGDISDDLQSMVTTTLDRMATGGFHDHVGGGFHRYSTDVEWRLPHFEKMLYDQAMLLLAFAEGWRRTGFARYKQIAERIVDYVRRDLTSDDGTFFAAEDADSEGVEGKFYVWSREDVVKVASEAFAESFDVRESGNFEDEATGRLTGENVLHMTHPGLVFEPDTPLYSRSHLDALQRLHVSRGARVRPGLDTKILVDWNGLMIAALARASRVFGDSKMLAMAVTAANAITAGFRKSSALGHLHKAPKSIAGMVDDYAFMCLAGIELYQATHEPEWLSLAIDLGEEMDTRFAAGGSGTLFMTAAEEQELIVRPVELNDGAIPSGNAVATDCYQRLYRLTGDTDWSDRCGRIIESAANKIARYPAGFTAMLRAMSAYQSGGREIVVLGPPVDPLVVAALELARGVSADDTVVHYLNTESESRLDFLSEMVNYLEPMVSDSATAVYICDNFACQMPIRGIDDLLPAL